ncbi:winged helix DNA-binding domain-containing protein [Kitasatospora sp. NPDC006697]|uniref:winged helix DNA-binding domain-containing protein n=1 Tax=Kitasatospora sp. NPDC006697 TaxID=3364020 RepID=UPI0036D127CE
MTRQQSLSLRTERARSQALAGGVREAGVAAVVRRVFAVQAQDATAAGLGIRVRGREITAEGVRAAYEDQRSIVRGWLMRGTLHTVPAEEYRWLLRLLAPRLLAGTGRRYGQLGLDDGLRQRSDRLLRRALGEHGPLTRMELTERLTALGVAPEGQAPIHLIRHAALGGILCHGPRRDGAATYALLDDWLPADQPGRPEGEAAVAELARRYLAAHAPAAVEDFAAWSGLPVGWARRAWAALARAGATAEYGTQTVPAGWTPAPRDASAAPDVRLLPAYDGYLLAYRTREESVPGPQQARVWPGGGVIRPTALADGLAVATWSRTGARVVGIEEFEPLPSAVAEGLAVEVAAVGRFLRAEG